MKEHTRGRHRTVNQMAALEDSLKPGANARRTHTVLESRPLVKIKPPIVNETPPLPTYAPRHMPKIDYIDTTPTKAKVRRVTEADLTQLVEWVPEAVKNQYPQLDERTFGRWLQAALYNNMCCVIRTEHMVAAAEVERTTFYPETVAKVHFIVRTGGNANEVIDMLNFLKEWAKSTQAAEIHFAGWEESEPSKIGKIFGAKESKKVDIISLRDA